MKNIMKNIFTMSIIATTLIACGDSSSGSNSGVEKVSVVATIYNLGDCTEELDGDTVFVRDKKMDYLCENGRWSAIDEKMETSSSAKETSCSSSQVSSSSSALNDSISSSSEEVSIDPTNESSSSENKKDSTTTDSISFVPINNKTISGVSQKGPFVNGSSVTVQELDGKTLAQTGKSFKGKISNDKGEFSVSSVSLASQYALLETNGYYQNEVTGAKSKAPITLNALVNFVDREKANVNLLTHLEYERVMFLVESGLSVDSAKKQANKEIIKSFGIVGDFTVSEDLDISSIGDGSAALLAISILMQGNLAEASLSERLAKFAKDIENDGEWNDEQMMVDIADDALSMDLNKIKSNIKSWKIGDETPNFEAIVNKFRWNNLGLGACSTENNAEIKQVSNEKSRNYEKYYVCEGGNWRKAEAIEIAIGTCSNKNVGKTAIYSYERNKKQYRFPVLCTDTGWTDISSDQYDTLSLKCTKDGDIMHSDWTDVYYVCKSGRIASLTPNDLDKTKSGTGNLWDWTKGVQADVENDNEGLWWAATDSIDGGNSVFYDSKGNKETSMNEPHFISEEEIAAKKGILFSYKLGPAHEYPFLITGFRVAEKGTDISSWKGICVAYSSSVPIKLELHLNDNYATSVSYDYHNVVIPASLETSVVNYEWSDFAQNGWGRELLAIGTALKNVKSIAFYLENSKEGSVYIKAVGKLNECTAN